MIEIIRKKLIKDVDNYYYELTQGYEEDICPKFLKDIENDYGLKLNEKDIRHLDSYANSYNIFFTTESFRKDCLYSHFGEITREERNKIENYDEQEFADFCFAKMDECVKDFISEFLTPKRIREIKLREIIK